MVCFGVKGVFFCLGMLWKSEGQLNSREKPNWNLEPSSKAHSIKDPTVTLSWMPSWRGKLDGLIIKPLGLSFIYESRTQEKDNQSNPLETVSKDANLKWYKSAQSKTTWSCTGLRYFIIISHFQILKVVHGRHPALLLVRAVPTPPWPFCIRELLSHPTLQFKASDVSHSRRSQEIDWLCLGRNSVLCMGALFGFQ